MKSGDQIKHKLSYLSRRLTPTTRKRGRRDAAKGFRVFLGCHITVTVHALLLQMSGYPPPSGVPAVHPPRPSSRFIPRSLSSNETDTLRLMTNITPCQERQANTSRSKSLDVAQKDRFAPEGKFCSGNIYFNHEAGL